MTQRNSRKHVETALGVAWYDREEWQHLRQVAADPEVLEEFYEEWVAMAEKSIRELEASGMIIERVPISTIDLIAWCREQDRPIDGSARAAFAAHRLGKLHLSE